MGKVIHDKTINDKYVFKFDDKVLDVLKRIGYLNTKTNSKNINIINLQQWLHENNYCHISTHIWKRTPNSEIGKDLDPSIKYYYDWDCTIMSDDCFNIGMYVCGFIKNKQYSDVSKKIFIFDNKFCDISSDCRIIPYKIYTTEQDAIFAALNTFILECLLFDVLGLLKHISESDTIDDVVKKPKKQKIKTREPNIIRTIRDNDNDYDIEKDLEWINHINSDYLDDIKDGYDKDFHINALIDSERENYKHKYTLYKTLYE